MITDVLVNHPNLYLVLALCYALLECWLGKTPTTKAGSVIELLYLAICRLLSRKESPVSPIIAGSGKVAKETKEVFDAAIGIARDFKAGLKPQEVAAKEFAALMTAMTGSDQIPSEREADPDAFAATVGAGVAQLLQVLLGSSPKA